MRGLAWNQMAPTGVSSEGRPTGCPPHHRCPKAPAPTATLAAARTSAPPIHEDPIIEAKELAAAAAALCDQKKGEGIQVIDVADRIKVADYFVVATGTSRAHVRALYDEVHARLKAAGASHPKAEGIDLGWWVVLDYGDVVVHLLQPEARTFYDIERLYGDCPRLDWNAVPLPELPEPRAARA